jgi:CRP-like cAMP-binding protein
MFEQSMLFKGISKRSKNVLASKSFYLKYPANTLIVKQGEPIYNLYFISKGSASVVRRCKKSSILSNEKLSTMNYMFKQKLLDIKESILLHVETLRKLHHFNLGAYYFR